MAHSSPFTCPGETGQMTWLLTFDCCWMKPLLQTCLFASKCTGRGTNWISLCEPSWKHCRVTPSSSLMETELRVLSSTTELYPLKMFKTRQRCVSNSNGFRLAGTTLAALLYIWQEGLIALWAGIRSLLNITANSWNFCLKCCVFRGKKNQNETKLWKNLGLVAAYWKQSS